MCVRAAAVQMGCELIQVLIRRWQFQPRQCTPG
jgi:hypothetical protein